MENGHPSELLYQPLDTIRLLRLSKSSSAKAWDGELLPFPLHSPHRPNFITLSYTWGPPTNSKSNTLIINGYKVPILDSVYSFLQNALSIRGLDGDVWWWIDSICIDQDNLQERGAQVKIMAQIYAMARRTVVWLGDEVDNSFEGAEDCSGAINSLQLLFRERWKHTTTKNGRSVVDTAAFPRLREKGSGVDWKAIERLFLRPWWRRVWTLQEFIIPEDLVLYCGSKGIQRSKFKSAMYAIYLSGVGNGGQSTESGLMSQRAFKLAWGRRRIDQWYREKDKPMQLVAMMAYMSDCETTDERDRVYSVRGLVQDCEVFGVPDYESSVDEIYTNVVRAYVEKYRNLDIICYAHLFNHYSPRMVIGTALPSWVPDWRANVESKVIPVMACQGSQSSIGNFRPLESFEHYTRYAASGNVTAKFRFSGSGRRFICQGVVVDIIDGLGGTAHVDADREKFVESNPDLQIYQSTSHINCGSNPLSIPVSEELSSPSTKSSLELMETVAHCLVLDRIDRYLNEKLPPGHFTDDLVSFCLAVLSQKHTHPKRVASSVQDLPVSDSMNINQTFLQWFELNEHLMIHGKSLRNHAISFSSRPLRKMNFETSTDQKSFLARFWYTIQTMARRLAVTEKGYLGMAPCRARKGDVVCVLFGCNIPVVLREREEGTWDFVGEIYLHGFMNGQGLRDKYGVEVGSREFELV